MAIKVGEKDLFPYLGDYGPVSIYKGEQKLAGYKWAEKSGQELHFDNTYNSLVEVEVDGQSYQHAGSGKNLINLRALDSLFVYAGGRVKTTNLSPIYTISGDVVTVSDQSLNYELLGYKYIVKDSIKNIYIKFSSTAGASSMLYYRCYDSTGVTTTSQLAREMAKNENIYSTMIQSSVIPQNTSYILIGIGFSLISDYALDSIIISHEDTQYEPPAPTPDYPSEIHSLNDFDVVSSTEKLTEGQLQEYDYGVEYENVDKINLNLSEPLRSVGNFKDRLFKDSGGLWKVERNVGYILLDGNQTLTVEHVLENTCRVRYQPGVQLIHIPMSDGLVKTSRFKTVHNTDNWRQDRELVEQDHSMVSIRINRGRLNGVTSSDVNNWFRSNHTEVLYTPSTPTIETLDQELQDKLNTLKSFKGSNYVYTVLPDDDLTPTLHAKTEVKDI